MTDAGIDLSEEAFAPGVDGDGARVLCAWLNANVATSFIEVCGFGDFTIPASCDITHRCMRFGDFTIAASCDITHIDVCGWTILRFQHL